MNTIGSILAKNRKKKGLSQSDLVVELKKHGIDITTKAISKWETNLREPNLSIFFTLCQILDIEDIYESYFGSNPFNIMSGLNEEGRNKVKEYVQILKASGMFAPETCKIIPFRYLDVYEDRVSAGVGNFLVDGTKESYNVGNLAPKTADFGVRISGDSMEPHFHDGEIAWIQQKEELVSGEIGIFLFNEEAYIKEFRDNIDGTFLVSHNKKYDPIPVTASDSFKIFGKVVGKCSPSDLDGIN